MHCGCPTNGSPSANTAGFGKREKMSHRLNVAIATLMLVVGLVTHGPATAQVGFGPGVCFTYTRGEKLPDVYMLTAGPINNLATHAHKDYLERLFGQKLQFGWDVEGKCVWYQGFPSGEDQWVSETINAVRSEFASLGFRRL